jgi:hypothetical protein
MLNGSKEQTTWQTTLRATIPLNKCRMATIIMEYIHTMISKKTLKKMKSKINKAMDKFCDWFYSTKVEDALNKIFLWAAIAFVIDVILLATGIL